MTPGAQQQDYFVYPCGFTCNDCSLVSMCAGTNKPPCSRPHPPAPERDDIDLSKIKTKDLINFYGKVLSEIESRGVTW